MEPSIAGVVGSTNIHGLGYAAEFSVQPGRQEIIGELDILAGASLIHILSFRELKRQELI